MRMFELFSNAVQHFFNFVSLQNTSDLVDNYVGLQVSQTKSLIVIPKACATRAA